MSAATAPRPNAHPLPRPSRGRRAGRQRPLRGGSTGLVYMYQRCYQPETGTFLSTAPYPPMMEHAYGFAEGNPVMGVDPDGRRAKAYTACVEVCADEVLKAVKLCEAAAEAAAKHIYMRRDHLRYYSGILRRG